MANPYNEADYDQAFLGNLGSSPIYIATRVLMLLVVFGLLARGIVKFELTTGLLLLPIAFEFLLMIWGGLILSLFFIDCPAFAQTAGRWGKVVFFTLVVLGIGSAMLAVDNGSVDLGRILPGWQWAWRRVLETGLIWALVAEMVWLVVSTVPEVRNWRRGRFIWTSSLGTSMRLAAIFFVVLVGIFVGPFLAEFVSAWLANPRSQAWLVFGLLLCIEVGALAIGVVVHRDLAGQKKRGLKERART